MCKIVSHYFVRSLPLSCFIGLQDCLSNQSGEPVGLVEGWFENGTLELRENYANGELDGLREEYRDNGTLSARKSYKDGERDGIWEDFREDGTTVLRRSKYAGGRVIGNCSRADCSDLN